MPRIQAFTICIIVRGAVIREKKDADRRKLISARRRNFSEAAPSNFLLPDTAFTAARDDCDFFLSPAFHRRFREDIRNAGVTGRNNCATLIWNPLVVQHTHTQIRVRVLVFVKSYGDSRSLQILQDYLTLANGILVCPSLESLPTVERTPFLQIL